MAITLRSVKGSALTVAELDGNFTDLDDRVGTLETNPVDANSVANITTDGSTVTFVLDDGTEFTGTLPTAVFAWRGDWAGETAYFTNDVVVVDGDGIYLVLQDHTSEATFSAAESNSAGDYYAHLFGVVTGTPYDFTLLMDTTPDAGATIDRIPIVRAVTIPANFSGSVASGGTPPDDFTGFTGYEISIQDDGSEIGTVSIDEAGVATWATTGGTTKSVAAGSILTMVAPDDGSDQDASIADWIFGIKASIA